MWSPGMPTTKVLSPGLMACGRTRYGAAASRFSSKAAVVASSQTGDWAFPVPGLVAVVTDSTASLAADEPGVPGAIVVPQRLLAGDFAADDGVLGAAADIEAAAARGVRLTT